MLMFSIVVSTYEHKELTTNYQMTDLQKLLITITKNIYLKANDLWHQKIYR